MLKKKFIDPMFGVVSARCHCQANDKVIYISNICHVLCYAVTSCKKSNGRLHPLTRQTASESGSC